MENLNIGKHGYNVVTVEFNNSLGDGILFVQVMKNWVYQEDIKCSPCEAMFGQCSIFVGWKTSNLPDDAIKDIFTEEELEKIVSREYWDEQNNLTEDPLKEIHVETMNRTSNNLVDNADMEGLLHVDIQEETSAEDIPSTKMVTEVACFP